MNTFESIWRRLREIVDPELGCNVVDLGLIRSVTLSGANLRVEMTLTSQGCPLGDVLAAAAESALLAVPGIETAEVRLVFEPPWSIAEMSPTARAQFGIPQEAPAAE
jgi:metal-sulfur cluster biosynthetic enzyme